jgi:hypothetical protein
MAKVLRREQRGDSEVKQLPSHPPQQDQMTQTGWEKSAHYLVEAWAPAPAVDVVTKPARCLGAHKTPPSSHCGFHRRAPSVTMSVLDVLWEDRDVRFDVSSQ